MRNLHELVCGPPTKRTSFFSFSLVLTSRSPELDAGRVKSTSSELVVSFRFRGLGHDGDWRTAEEGKIPMEDFERTVLDGQRQKAGSKGPNP